MKVLRLDIMAWFTFTIILVKLTCFVSSFGPHEEYESPTVFDTVRIYPGQDQLIVREDTGGSKHSSIRAFNLGKHPLEGDSQYSNPFRSSWTSVYHYSISPNELEIYDFPDQYSQTVLKLYGANGGSTIVYAERGIRPAGFVSHNTPPTPGLDISFKSIFRMIRGFASRAAMKFIPHPVAAIGVSLLIDTLFADGPEDPWNTVKDRVKQMIEESKMVIIETILSNDLEPIKDKVLRVQSSLGKGKINNKKKKKTARRFMGVLDIMVGLEKKFAFPVKNDAKAVDNKKLNYRILSLYSRVINMKVSFHAWGIAYAKDIGLDDDEVDEIQEELDATIENAEKHIADVYVQQVDIAYETCWPPQIFDCMMEVRSNVAANGMTYVSYWNTLKGGITYPNITNNVMLYSPFFGRASINLNKEVIINFGAPPLTPKLIKMKDGREKRNKLVKVELNMDKNKLDESIVVGAILHFENNDHHLVGRDSDSKETIDLGNEFITKIQVNGSTVVSRITFTLSNGKEFAFGPSSQYNHVIFEMDGYYISSFFMGNDIPNYGQQVANIAVSYQLYPDIVPAKETQENEENKAKRKNNSEEEDSGSEED